MTPQPRRRARREQRRQELFTQSTQGGTPTERLTAATRYLRAVLAEADRQGRTSEADKVRATIADTMMVAGARLTTPHRRSTT